VQLSNIQIIVVITTVVLLALFTWLVSSTRLGRDMRACEQDLSNESPDTPLPSAVATGEQQYLIVGALAGG